MRIIKLLVTLILVSCHLAASELKVEKISSVNNISKIQNSLGSGMSLKKVNYIFTNRIEESIFHNGSVIKLENTKQYYYPSRPIVPQKNFHISLSGYYHIDEISISNGLVEHYYTNGELAASDNPLLTDGNMQQEHISQKDRTIYDTHILSPTYRFADAILNKGESDRRVDISHYPPNIPDHFNYTSYEFLGNSYSKNKYAVITMFDKIIYDTVWDTVGRFNKDDFEKLEQDSTVDKLYSNGGCDAWYIHAKE